MKHILIIEDDMALNNGIVLALKDAEYRFFQATTLASAKELMLSQKMAMVILDINLPDGNGFEFLEAIRKESEVPVIILTANDMELDEVRGLNLGADDYITKPFSLMVLRSRIESVFRRSVKKNKSIYVIDDLYLDFEQMYFKAGDRELALSKTEQKLLHLLLENKERERLLAGLWWTEYGPMRPNMWMKMRCRLLLAVCVIKLKKTPEHLNTYRPYMDWAIHGGKSHEYF